jgi:hypothetical protein
MTATLRKARDVPDAVHLARRGRATRRARLVCVPLLFVLSLCAARVHAQASEPDVVPGAVQQEEPDPTRLDVARLPPEAIALDRDLYAQGFFAEAQLGAQGFLGDLGKLASPGPRLSIAFGYELATWLRLILQGEGSLHVTRNRPPPQHSAFEILGAALGLELGIPFNARAMLWGRGLAGVMSTGGDVLHTLGLTKAHTLGLQYGGELGFDWHMRSRHHSVGLLSGARLLPALSDATYSLALYGSTYLRYVF